MNSIDPYINFLRVWIQFHSVDERAPTREELQDFNDCGYCPSYKEPNPSELLEIFSPAIPTIKHNFRILKGCYDEVEIILKEAVEIAYKEYCVVLNSIDISPEEKKIIKDEFYEKILKHFYSKPLQKIDRRIKYLHRLLTLHEWKQKPQEENSNITDTDIARAKEYPLTALVGSSSYTEFVTCPLHREKTPSFKMYKRENRWHCFGCNEGGDTIDLIMKRDKLSFIEAVKKLIS